MYVGDIRLGDTIDVKFCTVNTSGVPTTLAGTPVVSAYPGNSTTQLTAGITLTVDFDTVTGLHNVRVVATSGNGYATATNYALVITTGTVGGSSVVGYVIGHFSIEARSALMPTTAARTLDVTATGGAGIDWANVENPTTALNLSATNIDVDQVVASVSGAVGSVTAGVTLAASAVQAIWDALTSALTTAGSVGKLLVDNINATISSRSSHSAADVWAAATRTLTAATNITSTGGTTVPQTGDSFARLGAPAGASVSADIDAIPTAVENADTLLDRDMATGTDSGSATVRTVRQALRFLRNKWSISAGTLTVTKEDDTTTSWTGAVTTTAGDPVSTIDPAS